MLLDNDETVQCTKENQDTIEDKYFQKFLKEWKGVDPKEEEDETYKVIPKFYYKVRIYIIKVIVVNVDLILI